MSELKTVRFPKGVRSLAIKEFGCWLGELITRCPELADSTVFDFRPENEVVEKTERTMIFQFGSYRSVYKYSGLSYPPYQAPRKSSELEHLILTVCNMEIERIFPEYEDDFCVSLENLKIRDGICKNFLKQGQMAFETLRNFADCIKPRTPSPHRVPTEDRKTRDETNTKEANHPIYVKCDAELLESCQCGMKVNPEVMEEHLELVCLQRVVKCPLSSEGCNWKGKWNQVGDHLHLCEQSLVRCYECGKFVTRRCYSMHGINHAYVRERFEFLNRFRGISVLKKCLRCNRLFFSFNCERPSLDFCESHRDNSAREQNSIQPHELFYKQGHHLETTIHGTSRKSVFWEHLTAQEQKASLRTGIADYIYIPEELVQLVFSFLFRGNLLANLTNSFSSMNMKFMHRDSDGTFETFPTDEANCPAEWITNDPEFEVQHFRLKVDWEVINYTNAMFGHKPLNKLFE